METKYEISIQMKTLKGIAEYGSFYIGANKAFAASLYQKMEGSKVILPKSIITMELVKWSKGLPYPLGILHCNDVQLANNIKLITKEMFKYFNL